MSAGSSARRALKSWEKDEAAPAKGTTGRAKGPARNVAGYRVSTLRRRAIKRAVDRAAEMKGDE